MSALHQQPRSPLRRRLRTRAWAALVFGALQGFLLVVFPATAGDPTPLERMVKAGCLFRFAQFVTWPDSAFASNSAPLVVSVLAPEPWHQPIRESLAGKKVDGHPIEVRILAGGAPVDAGHLLFVTAPEHRQFASLLAARPRGTLTVGETEPFLATGGMIAFVLVEGKVRFDVDAGAAAQAGFNIHPGMLAQARHVRGAAKSARSR